MTETNRKKFNKNVVALAMASSISLISHPVAAAGLGKLNVLSGLGQPLRAEVELGATKDELGGIAVRLAPQDAFRQAGVDFSSTLLELRFSIEKRANGQSVVKVSSTKPINEPFMDFLLELNWASGRLVREYTFLLDPPDSLIKQAAPQVAEARVIESVRAAAVVPEPKPVALKSALHAKPPAVAKATGESKKKPAAEPADTHLVKQGETLRKIATETKYDSVSLEQMLVGLFKNNPDAFIANDINRLKAGAILNMPEKAAVESVPQTEAKKVYTAQAADWGGYRRKLAAAAAKEPAKSDAASQSSSGKVTAKVEEKIAPVEPSRDQVKVARTEAAAKGEKANAAAEEADRIAKEKALKEAQERVVLLEKNVGDLQKLLEMKSQRLAELQQAPKKEEPKPVEPPKPIVEPAKPAEEPKPVALPKPAETQLAEPAAPKPAEVAPPPPPPAPKKVVAPPPPPPSEPDFMDSLLEDPLPLAGAGGVLALLAGFFMLKRRRGSAASAETTAVPAPSSLGPNSVFRMTGGQSIDTGNTPPQTGEFSQTGPGTIDTDEVDPVAEADVYMAYGRDTQAEEILLEALQKDPQRTAIHAKLLEIYANRSSVKQFETLASELYAQTGGIGAEWVKVAAMGARLEPGNPLYSGGSSPAAEVAVLPMPMDVHVMDAVPAPEWSEPTLSPIAEALPPDAAEPKFSNAVEESAADEGLDFDFGMATENPSSQADEIPVETNTANDALDFDLGADFAIAEEPSASPAPELAVEDDAAALSDLMVEPLTSAGVDFSPEGTLVSPPMLGGEGFDAETLVDAEIHFESPAVDSGALAVDFDLDLPSEPASGVVDTVGLDASATATVVDGNFLAAAEVEGAGEPAPNALAVEEDSLDFDVRLTDSVFLGAPEIQSEFDIGSIDLDLSSDEPAIPSAEGAGVEAPVTNEPAGAERDAHWDEVNTKLDLAKAYEEMGDLEGARELLQEVVAEGPDDLVEQARALLSRVGG